MFESPGFRPKTEDELQIQTENVGANIDASIVPASIKDTVEGMTAEEIKQKFPRRYEIYLDILRHQKRESKPDSLPSMKKWVTALNALDEYVLGHQAGEHDGLREHQIPVFEKLRDYLEQGGNNGYIKMPTGTGKTVMFSKFVQALNLRTLVIVPKKTLVTQTHEEFDEHTIGLEVGKFYGDEKDLNKQVTVITYQSLISQVKSGEINPADFGCVILDEAHKSQGEQTQEILSQFTDSINIGFTATPGKLEATSEEIHSITLREAVEDFGALCSAQARFVKTKTDLSNVALTSSGNYSDDELEKAVNVYSRNKAAVEVYKQYHAEENGVVYCSGVKHAESITAMFNQEGIIAETISGSDSKKVQDDKLERFRKGEITILCNADILIEGFNAPNASVCLNLRPTRSLIVAEQRAGRVLRLDKNNPDKLATVIDFIDEAEDPKKMPITFADIIDGAILNNPNQNRSVKNSDKNDDGREDYLDLNIEGAEVIFDIEDVNELRLKMKQLRESVDVGFYETYQDAEKAVRELEITSSGDYKKRYKEDSRLPANPNKIYSDSGWTSWHDFLGKERLYETYGEAQNIVQKLGISSKTDFEKRYKEDPRLPANPGMVYSNNGWTNWYDFLGKEMPKELYQSYQDAEKVVREMGITSSGDYARKYKEDPQLPASPAQFYDNNGWTSWPVFLGVETKKEFYKTFAEARGAAQRLGISSKTDFEKRYKEDPRLPAAPQLTYKDQGWINWADFLGKETLKESYQSYQDAEKAVREMGITSSGDYARKYKEDPRLPAAPDRIYKDNGWTSWHDFLGKERLYETYDEARQATQELNIASRGEYKKRYKEDPQLPANPNRVYSSNWTNWHDFLGKEK